MRTAFILFSFIFSTSILAQHTAKNIQHDGMTRDFLEYVPAAYNGSQAVPLVICLHGLGDNMNNFSNIGMGFVADTANFIVLTPQAIVDPTTGYSAWHSGVVYFGYETNANIDDVGFINALVDSTTAAYNIDLNRVYVCGFSKGGFMTNRLACESPNTFAAVASVAGTRATNLSCNPTRTLPHCHFHGTADGTVSYNAGTYGMNAEDLTSWWVSHNNCATPGDSSQFPDIASDGYTVDHFYYMGGDDGTEVELFRVNGADHVWLTPSNDIFYTTEIWKFFMKHERPAGVGLDENKPQILGVYPNPSSGLVQFELAAAGKLTVYDLSGRVISEKNVSAGYQNIHIESKGVYSMVVVLDNGASYQQKVIIE